MSDDPKAIRAAAVAAHSEAWRFLGMVRRTPAEDAAMIAAAEKSLRNWLRVGTAVNEQRGAWLLARVHVAAGHTTSALGWADRTLHLTEVHRDELQDFDVAFAQEAAARARALSGDLRRATEHLRNARELGKSIGDPQDRRVFFEQLDAGPWFDLTSSPATV